MREKKLHRKSDCTDPMFHTRWFVLHLVGDGSQVYFNELIVSLHHGKLSLIPPSYDIIGKEECSAV